MDLAVLCNESSHWVNTDVGVVDLVVFREFEETCEDGDAVLSGDVDE